jgi:NAD(P)-dependent dehydrogenase (short-subunit alcohol dehydrogenase family)
MNLVDKVVVITGSSRGLGLGLARKLVEAGSKVMISSKDGDELQSLAVDIGCGYSIGDVRDKKSVNKLYDKAARVFGRVDIWINNAGVQIAPSDVSDIADDRIRYLFDVNFFGYLYGCQVASTHMKKQGSGLIININSTAGLDGKPGLAAYCSSKFAVKGLTQSLRAELVGSGVEVYGIHPGGIRTDIYHEQVPGDINQYMSVDHAADKIVGNLLSDTPEIDQIIRRPSAV